jgi:predicted metal-binding transcription factor (methanogenesis marker protein 9)
LPRVDADEGNSFGSLAPNVEVVTACPRDGTMKKVRMEEEEGTKGKSGNMADVIGLTHSTDVIVTISAIYMCG